MTAPCEQADRLTAIEGRLGTIETDQAVSAERWRTVDVKLDGLGAALDAHTAASEQRSADLVKTLLADQRADRADRKQIALKAIGVIGTILAALAGAGGVGWLAGGEAAVAVQAGQPPPVDMDGAADMSP